MLLALTMVVGFAAADHRTDSVFSGYDKTSALSFSEYSSTTELVSSFIAPFMLLFLIFQRGLEKALLVTLDDNDQNQNMWPSRESEKKRMKKYSVIMSLAITAMMVPTKWFRMIDDVTAAVFGSVTFLLYAAVVLVVLWIGFRVLSG